MGKAPSAKIRGAGGGGGDSSTKDTPIEAPDSLKSSAAAQILDLVCEGEIEGLADGLKSVYLDGTPVENPDGTFNFPGLLIETRVGTQGQTYLSSIPNEKSGASDVENEISVGVEVKNGAPGPIIRTITNPNVDTVRVTISFPQMCYTQSFTGNLLGTHVRYGIDIQTNGGGFHLVKDETIFGKSMSKYQRNYRFDLSGSPPWDIRVRRISIDEASSAIQNHTFWESYTEIEEAKLSYPNSALIALRVNASQFSAIPTRSYDLKLLKIKVPTNYDPVTRIYSGSWDGSFNIAWTDNPAWVFYDLITATRYGLGNFINPDNVDKWSIYSIAKYCDELVPNGFGGMEPRFTCNLYLQSQAEAFKVINDLASIFRSMAYWAGGALTLSQDSPQDAGYLFTPANVIEGLFNYVGASAKARHTVVLVQWNDPASFYAQKMEYVEDSEGIAAFGIIETQVVAMGCTSRGQAHRLGRWILLTEKYQSETVGFKTGLEGATLRPGQVIKIADPVRAGSRRGGRISSATVSAITTDDVSLIFTSGLLISVLQPDNTIEERAVQGITAGVVSLGSALTQVPQPGAIWMIADTAVEPQQFRVITVIESSTGVFEITALAHNPTKFDSIDFGTILEPQSVSNLRETPASPTNLSVTETLYAVGKDVRTKITLSWSTVDKAVSYIVQWTRNSQNVIVIPETNSNDIEILNAEPGRYQFWIYALSAFGKRSVPSTVNGLIRGTSTPPINISNFSLIPVAGMAYLTWDPATDLDVLIGGSVRIRYSPDLVTPAWSSSVDIMEALPGTATHANAPLLTGTYMAKFVDSSGNASPNEAGIVTTVPSALALNVVQTVAENPNFLGTRIGMDRNVDLGGMSLASSILIDDLLDFDSISDVDFLGPVLSSGEYDFASTTDLGSVFTSRVTVALAAEGIDVTATIDQRLDNADDWQDLDAALIDDVNACLYLRTTSDNPLSSPTWSVWKPFFVGEYTARAFQFKLIATSNNPSHSILITTLTVTIDMADRTVNMPALSSGIVTYSVLFADAFNVAPAVGITGHNMNSGDYFVIANKTGSGFDITFKNSSGVNVSRTFDVLAKGYGRAG